jgi:probable F420-dependent oxidoreductase
VKVDTGINADLHTVASEAAAREAQGFSGLWSAETNHDPFLPLVLTAEHTTTVELGTMIAVAFARNPMLLANLGQDLQAYSRGRFVLGLGSQVKPHITRRFSMPWSHPAPRMRELILAVRAIWAAWNDRTKLDFRGEYYTHTLMTPFFDPGPNPYGAPKIFLAGVGEFMTEVAGEVADGFICHAFTTERYLRDVTVPALERGRAKAGKTMDGFQIVGPSLIATGLNDADRQRAEAATRKQVAFYGSTPAYRGVLELHGWGELHDDLHRLSQRGQWNDMERLVDDEVLGTFAIVGAPDAIAPEIHRRFGDVIQRINFYVPYDARLEKWQPIVDAVKA